MEDNPYSALLGMIRTPKGTETETLCLGKVTGVAPLRVLVGGNTLEERELLASAELLPDEEEIAAELTGHLSVSAGCSEGSISSAEVRGGTLTGKVRRTKRAFRLGDQVLMMPIEAAQRYIILCRVVEL